ncbi:MAG: hypothetical protein ABI895_16990 [Deltaproteobacteria bacterium]
MAHTHLGSDGNGKQGGARKTPASSSKRRAASKTAAIGSKEGQARVQEVLDRFARAMTAGAAEAVADLWETPAFVLGAGMVRAVATREEVVAFFSGTKEQYTSRGIDDTRAEIQRLDWVSDDLVVVDVRWPYLNADGDEVGEETSSYTLVADDEGRLKIRSVLMRGAAE